MKRPDEYDAYIRSARWKNICALKKRDVSNKCERCGHSSARLEVHHMTYERFKKERFSDLCVLCTTCHEIEDAKREKDQAKKASKRLYDARFEGYMNAKYGEGHLQTTDASEHDHEEFEAWLEKKVEQEMFE